MAPVSMMVKPSRRASWRATVLLPAPAGPSMATMGAVTSGLIPRAASRIKRSSMQRQEEREPHQGDGGDAPRQPAPRRAIGLRLLLLLLAGHGKRLRPDGSFRERNRG